MEIRTNYFKLGLFVLIGLGILLILLVALGAGQFTKDTVYMETYFNESVQGLSSGSMVHYRGFPIGKVERISFVTQEYDIRAGSELYDKYLKYVMVVFAIEKKELADYDEDMMKEMFKTAVKEGARIRLTQQPLTGLSYLDIDFLDPNRYPAMELPWQPEYLYVPSAPSLLSTFTQSAEEAFKQLAKIDIAKITKDADDMLVAVKTAFEDADIKNISDQVKIFLEEIRSTNQDLKQLLATGDERALATLPETIDRFDATLNEVQFFFRTRSGDFSRILDNIKRISTNLSQLSEELKQQPSRLLYSNPPAETEVLK